MIRAVTALAAAAVMAGASGCAGNGFVGGEGVVTREGAPVAGAAVMFLPESEHGLPAGGTTDAAGRFVLETANASGIRPGRYKVTVSKTEPLEPTGAFVPGAPPSLKPKVRHLLPVIYADARTTPLHIDVPAGGTKTISLVLEGKLEPPPPVAPSGSRGNKGPETTAARAAP